MKASLIIPAHGRPELVSRLLESLLATQQPLADVEILVIENGLKSGVEEVVKSFWPRLRVLYEYRTEANLGAARNHGAAVAQGELLVFIDDDIRVRPGFLSAYLSAFAKHGSGRFYGGALAADYELAPPAWLESHLPASARGFTPICSDPAAVSEPIFVGGNFAIPRVLFESHGPFDRMSASGASNSGLMGEETRLQQRMLAAGALGVFVSGAEVLHWVPADRCSVDWLVQRRRRAGATDAETANAHTTGPLGFPKWMLLAWAKDSLALLKAKFTGAHQQASIVPLLHRAYLDGYIRHAGGRRLRRQR